MTLTTHILVAAVVTKPIVESEPNSWLVILVVAFASHFLADAIPHWDYSLASLQGSKRRRTSDVSDASLTLDPQLIIKDLAHVGCDIIVGFSILVAIYQPSLDIAAVAPLFFTAVGGILPDALQPVYWLWKQSPVKYLQRFHHFMHAQSHLSFLPLGISSQFAIVVACVVALAYF